MERTYAKDIKRRNHDRESAAINLAEDVLCVVRGEKHNFDYDKATSYSATVAELNALMVGLDQHILNRFEREFNDRTNKVVEIR